MKTEESHHDQDLQKAIRYSSRSILVNSEILIRKNWDLKKKKKEFCLSAMREGGKRKYLHNHLPKTTTEDICATNNRLLYDRYIAVS